MQKNILPTDIKAIKAFTLIELSIVLAIIGLIASGIMAGKSIVAQAQIRSVISDIHKYQTAILSFKAQYGFLPGDLPNAYDYWGSDMGCANATSSYSLLPGTNGCNGNGDGMIGSGGASGMFEGRKAWQQMVYANLINGSYSGSIGNYPNWDCLPAQNVPISALPNVAYELTDQPPVLTAGMSNALVIGTTVTTDMCWGAGLIPIQSKSIDMKLDDGLPSVGKFLSATGGGGASCTSGSDYDLTRNTRECYSGYTRMW